MGAGAGLDEVSIFDRHILDTGRLIDIISASALGTLVVHIESPAVGLAGRIDGDVVVSTYCDHFCRPDFRGGQLGSLDQDAWLIRGVFDDVGGGKRVRI